MNLRFIKHCKDATTQHKAFLLFQDSDRQMLPSAFAAQVDDLVKREVYSFAVGSLRSFNDGERTGILLGAGKESAKLSTEALRTAISKLFDLVRSERIDSLKLEIAAQPLEKASVYRIIAEQAVASRYVYDRYKSERKDPVFDTLYLIDARAGAAEEAALVEGKLLAEAVCTTRFLVDEPANKLYPEILAQKAESIGKEAGFEVEVFKTKAIEKLGMHAYLEVARAAARPPRLIVMRYQGAPQDEKIYGLVGKGLCYDTGGYSLKPSKGMEDMKIDMGGSATVIGAMEAIAKAKLPINVTAVVASCMNMVGPDGYLPGDIISSMGGKSIYIGNTDAEGRLTLVDALTYIIRKEKVCSVFDFATLTGAVLVALGTACAAAISNDDALYADYAKAAERANEKIWRLPVFDEYRELVKHADADLTNSAGHPGTITAGVFLGEFVEDTPWIHVDIAGTVSLSKPSGFYGKNATGYGVRTVYEYMKAKA